MNLKTPLKEAGRLYKMYASRLEKLSIKTLEDFLYHAPFRYEDYSLITKIKRVKPGQIATIQGTVVEFKNELTKNYKKIQKARIADETGEMDVIWFNQPYLSRVIEKGSRISLSGKIQWFLRELVMESPEYEIIYDNQETEIKTVHTGRIVPVYPETHGVSSKWLRRQVYKILLEEKQNMFEYIPDSIIKNHGLIEFCEAIEQIHFPKSLELSERARQRLAFDELFILQLSASKRRHEWEKNLVSQPFSVPKFQKNIEEFWNKLPFTLTNAQKKAVDEIFADLSSKKPMNRLLEGDVGSGKTVVGAIAMYLAFLNGFQSVLMAPTEILAQQHYKTIFNLLFPLGVKVELVTGSKKLESRIKNQELRIKKTHNSKFIIHDSKNDFDILIGTHAVLSDNIKFNNLALVIIDEQQRFGVEQRALIKSRGEKSHLLTMTATPIPRTVALTMYGDLDLSYLNEMPIGRKQVKTWLVPDEKRSSAYQWIKEEIKKTNSQVFIVCPFIEESESMQTVKAAAKEFEKLKKEVFKNLKVGLLHGKLKSKEKDIVIQEFKDKKLDILVATPVVEVGIDIPNATIIIIEAAERFGLAQLHQLRGRVGRGDKQSYCLLFTEAKNPKTLERLKAMESMHSGAQLAELDLKLRGPGDMYGTMQHGLPQLKIASFSDFSLIEKVRKESERIFPKLSEYPLLLKKLSEVTIKLVNQD